MISIIVPCYNQARFLSDTLKSIINQDYSNWECFIINDGSNDNTIEVAKVFCNVDSRIRLLNKKNEGLAVARNYGIAASKGEYILPLDADDLIAPEYINKAIEILEKHSDVEIVYSMAELFGVVNKRWDLPEYSLEMMLGRNCIFCSGIFRRKTFGKTAGYRTNLKFGFQDWDLWLSILELGGKVCRVNEVLFYYRQRTNSMINSKTPEQFEHLRRTIWENHKLLYSKVCFLPQNSFEFQKLYSSPAYRLGSTLLIPLQSLYSVIKMIRSRKDIYRLPNYLKKTNKLIIDYTIYGE